MLAIVGTGVQARAHARAVPLVRDFGELRVGGRRPGEGRAARARSCAKPACRRAPRPPTRTRSAAPTSSARRRISSSPSCGASGWRRAPHVTSVGYNPAGPARSTTPRSSTRSWWSSRARPRSRRRRPVRQPDLVEPIRDGLIGDGRTCTRRSASSWRASRPGRPSTRRRSRSTNRVGVAVQDAAAAARRARPSARETDAGPVRGPSARRSAATATSRSFCASARLWSFFSDWFSIWRMRSRVTLNVRPTSSSVRGCSPPRP